ncbi:fibronectin type III domain-containing protein [Thiocapsa rosea]|uniref:fibronectin type III domain-containing protein n=1 Tax=Thiocapsa rosea TaxID=69360 RepID=UPI0011C3D80E|nr:fibronectin type III domain-containing protein [Thiocapsa rosea]
MPGVLFDFFSRCGTSRLREDDGLTHTVDFGAAESSIAQPTGIEIMLERTATPETRLITAAFGSHLGTRSADRESTGLVAGKCRATSQRIESVGWAFLAFAVSGDCFGADVRVTWNPVDDPRASRYQVHFGQASRTYVGSVDTTQTTAVISGLTPGQLHYLAVRACTADNLACSDFSNEVIAAIAPDGEVLPVEPCWACLPNGGGWRALLK